MRKFFVGRASLYQEKHVRLHRFIDPLLRAYCRALQDELSAQKASGRAISKSQSFINDFLQFCIVSERWDEMEVLLQECSCGFRETRADSGDDEWMWFPIQSGAQSELAQLHVPAPSFYWEDSRMYMRTWESLTLFRAPVVDLMPNLPFSIAIDADKIEYEKPDEETLLEGSEILAVLERKRQASDWEILAAWDQQIYSPKILEIARNLLPHIIWIFPEDIVEDGHDLDKESEYGFIHLGGDQSEWLAVRKHHSNSGIKQPNEPGERRTPSSNAYHQRTPGTQWRQVWTAKSRIWVGKGDDQAP